MRRRLAALAALAGAAGVAGSFFFPSDFAWNGLNTLKLCMETARYASDAWARLAWYGFAACVLYPPVWAISAGVAVAWRRPSPVAARLPAVVTVAGSLLVSLLGVLLLVRIETWPAPPLQWLAAAAPAGHVLILWTVLRRAGSARRAAAVVWVGGIPFVVLYAMLMAASARYGAPVAGYAAALASMLVLLVAAIASVKAR